MRGAPAIGVAAAYGLALAAARGEDVDAAYETLAGSRPTAVNLRWALDEMRPDPTAERARAIHEDEVGRCRRMSAHALELFPERRPRPHALQRRRAGDGWLRHRGRRGTSCVGVGPRRTRVGRRDAAAAAGSAADRVGARAARHPARGDRRRRSSVPDGARRGRSRRHGRRPDRGKRRYGQQDRHLRAGRAGAASRHPARRRRPDLDARSGAPRAARRSRSRSAPQTR